MSSGESTVSLCAVGDIRIMRDKDPEKVLELVAPIIRNADITFAQLEGNLAEKGSPQGGYANVMMAPPSSVKGLTYAGIDVVSVRIHGLLDRRLQDRAVELLREARGEGAFGSAIVKFHYPEARPEGMDPDSDAARIPIHDESPEPFREVRL